MPEADHGSRTSGRTLTAFQQNLLAVLAAEPNYGLAVKRELEDYYGSEVNHGRLYPNLDDLVKMGFVEKSALDKRTNEYAITDDGAEALLEDLEWKLEKLLASAEYGERTRSLLEDR